MSDEEKGNERACKELFANGDANVFEINIYSPFSFSFDIVENKNSESNERFTKIAGRHGEK